MSSLLCGLPSCAEKATSDCASCKSRGYCSKEHQRDDWKAHKVECKRVSKALKAAKAEGGAAGGGGAGTAAVEGKDAGGAASGGGLAVPAEEIDAGGDGGGAVEQPTPVARHITILAKMEEDAFDINTTPCGPHRLCALEFALGGGGMNR